MQTFFTGIGPGFSVDKAFKDGFADALILSTDQFGGESCEYWNPFNKLDRKPEVAKAFAKISKVAPGGSINTQTGGEGTAGTALIPVWVDPNIVDRTVRETPLRNILPRRAIRGLTYDYIPLTAKGGAAWALENQAIADQEDTYDRQSIAVKYLYAKGRISGPAIAAMRGFIDATQLDLTVKTVSILEAEEDGWINGDSSTNPEEPNGLIQTISTNTTNLSGAVPTLAQIRAEYATSYDAKGIINLAVTDATTHNYIKALLLDLQRQITNPSMAVLGFGIPDAFEFDGVLFIRDKFMPTTAAARRILFLDTRFLFTAVLQDLTYEEKFSDNDNYPFLLKEYITFAITYEGACTMMYGIQ